ncbi:hypothetical protein AYJ54_41035 [Bradyrhizobium centrolobii]|uniref:Uncharacterized protein n=1 Tax=Bradyrhizobium centrolobii TaxID=1505087 RepID=A0A176Z5E5_9BRAD|nr:hypothetical protein [Bradyrhizobium centrolobii]OAF14956.1 hypothetical protein AYJ54_41035 [Bradyrhizobium centrolobii]
MSIPLRIYITPFAEKGVPESGKWDCNTAKKALDVVNTIWSKAKIAFVISDCLIDKPLDMAKSARNSDKRVLDVLSLRHAPDNAVHIYLVNPIQNLAAGGSSYLHSDPEPASFVQWYGDDFANGRAWAHELGHLMSVDHVEIDYTNERQAAALRGNLMTKGLSVGSDLTKQQIETAKNSKLVKRFGA